MSENPYAPPSSKVADVDTDTDVPVQRPREVLWAVVLCWLSAMAAIPSIIEGYTSLAQIEGGPFAQAGYLVIQVAVMALMVWVIVSLARGRNWARIVYAALTALSLAIIVGTLDEVLAEPWYWQSATFLTTLADILIVVLLFRPAANAWYRARGQRPADAPT